MRFAEGKMVTAVATGATVFAAARFGVLQRIPAIGPVPAPIATILLGVLIVGFLGKSGMVGEVLDGAGYGLIAAGVLEMGVA